MPQQILAIEAGVFVAAIVAQGAGSRLPDAHIHALDRALRFGADLYIDALEGQRAAIDAFDAANVAYVATQGSNTSVPITCADALEATRSAFRYAVPEVDGLLLFCDSEDYSILLEGNTVDIEACLRRSLWPTERLSQLEPYIEHWERGLLPYPELASLVSNYRRVFEGDFNWDQGPAVVEAWYKRHQQERQREAESGHPPPDVSPDTAELHVEEHAAEVALGSFRRAIPSTQADQPATVDLLGRELWVAALAEVFADPEQGTPLTVGLFGDWGTGKSSLMDQLRRQLQANPSGKFDTAWFNAWEYENTDNLAAGLAQEVVQGLRAPNWLDRLEERICFAVREHGPEFGKTVFFTLLTLVTAGLLARPLIASASPGLAAVAQLGGAGVVLAATIYLVQHLRKAWDHPLATQLQTYLKLPNYGEYLGLTPVLKRHVRTLCSIRLLHWRRLVVFVDDLDRCKPDSIVAVLEAIRLVMDIPNVIVLVAIDQRIALQAVARHFAKVGGDERAPEDIARDYLGKIIQIPLRLSHPNPAEVQNYIHQRLFANLQDAPIDRDQTEWLRNLQEAEGGSRDLRKRVEAGDWGALDEIQSGADRLEIESGIGGGDERGAGGDSKSGGISPAPRTGPMRETLAERVRFTELSRDLDFTNPRQLLRLRNTYRLSKRLYSEEASWERLMEMLFWQEFLHQWPFTVHRACEDGLKTTKVSLPSSNDLTKEQEDLIHAVIERMRGVFQERYSEDWQAYEQVARKVKRLVLPRATTSTKSLEPAEGD